MLQSAMSKPYRSDRSHDEKLRSHDSNFACSSRLKQMARPLWDAASVKVQPLNDISRAST